MKKLIKSFLCIICCLALILSLCGCNAIDELRKNQAHRNSDGTILYADNTYLPLDHEVDALVNTGEHTEALFVTDEPVPVLLSMFLGEEYYLCGDGIFLFTYSEEYSTYCRSDYYDKVLKGAKDGFDIAGYCYEYYEYTDDMFDFKTLYYNLSNKEIDAIKDVLNTVKPKPDDSFGEDCYYVPINAISEDKLFIEFFAEVVIEGDNYSIVRYTEEDSLKYKVPKKYNGIFEKMTAAYIENY